MIDIEKFRKETEHEKERVFPDARMIVLEELAFYLKLRIILGEDIFIEARVNTGSKRESFVLVRKNKRIAGFDNLGSWHFHPCGKASGHRKIVKPSVRRIFQYLADCYKLII